MEHRSTNASRYALTGVALAAACLWGEPAAALGLGRLNVQSALGEALRAEIDVTSLTAEEAASLRLRVAPPEAYRTAGVDYNAVLPSTTVQILKRSDGRSVLRVVSDRAVLEPFVDVIIEANWTSGRLVREYTLLFDPPASRTAQAPASVTPPVATAAPALTAAGPTPTAQATPVAAAPGVAGPAPSPAALTAASPAASPAPDPVTRPAAPPRARALSATAPPSPPAPVAPTAQATAPAPKGGDSYTVRPGESLSRVAARTQQPGISLDQMLVSLFRGNPQAFIADNINLLKAGAVLTVPSAEQAGQVGAAEARDIIIAQSTDFGAYRQRLATAAPATADAAPARQAKGSVQAQVEDRKAAAAATPDRLKLSQGAVKSAPPESVAAEKKDNTTRLAELNRNVEDLRKLQGATAKAPAAPKAEAAAARVAASSGGGATLMAAAPPAAVAPAAAPSAAAAASAVAAVAAVPAVPAVAPVAAPLPPPTAASTAASAASVPASVPAAKVAVTKPAPPPAQPPAAEGPGMLDDLLDNGLLAPAAGVLLALLAGLGLYRLRGRARKPAGETSFLESRLQPDSFFGASGGQRVDTRDASASGASGNSSSMSYSMSQLDAIGDVDPVAEADVYLAYGRDLQAEEILKEAMRAAPDRMTIRTKLLEVYAKRRDIKAFELLATQLYSLTRGEGEDWAKAQALGLGIDPENPLYHADGAPEGMRQSSVSIQADALGASTQPYTTPVTAPVFQPASDATLDAALDLDLDLSLDLTPDEPPPAPQDRSPSDQAQNLLRMADAPDLAPTTRTVSMPRLPEPTAPAGNSLDFDLASLSDEDAAGAAGPAPAPGLDDDATLDFGDFDLGDAPPATADMAALARKLELAEEFRQIGDVEGARDLLEEVLAKSEGGLKSKAQGMLDQLARG